MAKKKTINDFMKMKQDGEIVSWMVLYDTPFASYAEAAGMDMILVGDSMGMIVYGFDDTIPVTMDMEIAHCQAVRRGAPNTYIIGDMPFGSYQASVEDAVNNAVRFYKEGGVDAIKLEGGVAVAPQIKAIAQSGMVVVGHIGLTPQSSAAMGGFRAQGRTIDSAKAVIEDAIAVYEAGARILCLEGIPEETARLIHDILPIPVYGIGAGAGLDGQVLVIGDLLGMFTGFTPKFAKKYANLAEVSTNAIAQYVKEVKAGEFPTDAHKYKLSGDPADFEELFNSYRQKYIK